MAKPGNSSSDRRPTKAERKEEARLERERIERQMRSRKRNRTIGFALVGVALAAIVAIVAVAKPWEGNDEAAKSKMEQLVAQAPSAAEAAGCKTVENVGTYQGAEPGPNSPDASHIATISEMPPLDSYPSTPPASGPHNQTPLPAGVYDDPPPIDEAIHSLEHGGTIVWFAPDADPSAVQEIKDLYSRKGEPIGQNRVIVAPYDYGDEPGAQLPDGVQMALISWHNVQTCAEPSAAVAFDFTSQYGWYDPPLLGRPYVGDSPVGERGAPM